MGSAGRIAGDCWQNGADNGGLPTRVLANYIDELEDFYHAVTDKREPAATGVDGLRAVELTLAMITATRERRTVKIERRTS